MTLQAGIILIMGLAGVTLGTGWNGIFTLGRVVHMAIYAGDVTLVSAAVSGNGVDLLAVAL